MIIYLHGFNSSPDSIKAQQLHAFMKQLGLAQLYHCPALPPDPAAAIQDIELLLHKIGPATLIGSSLGGYYATWLAERYNLRAVLINPVVCPAERFNSLLGPQHNLYTGNEWILTQAHLDSLSALDIPVFRLSNYLLLVEKGDEVLAWQDAVRHYAGTEQKIFPGGRHSFTRFKQCLPDILAFAGLMRND
ncbi:MAG: alpha/beta fold hydrolase [Pseudomonadota bacterium]|nr:alpha/beta fold hydrolase [Pseudomonadota bacterium]